MMRKALLTVESRQGHCLIADNYLLSIARGRIDPSQVGIRFASCDKERAGVVKRGQSFEVEVGAIHSINGRRHWNHQVQYVDIVQFAVGNTYKTRDIPTQIQQRMHFHRGLGSAKWSPGKQRQTEVYRGGVQCINGVFEIQSKIVFGIELSRLRDQPLCKLGVDSPISM